VDVGAEAKVQVSVLGQNYSWTGPVPFVPQFDWQVEASEAFDPWAFTGFAVNGSTPTETLFQIDVLDFIGINIPGLSGSLDLDVAMDLDARYRTERIVITHVDGVPVEGGPIEGFGQTSLAQYLGGPSVDLDVRIDGQVRYTGVLHLIPTFSIETIGPDFSIPIVDVPVPFTYTDDDYDFDAVRVHVPLPDIELEGEDAGSSGGEFPVEPTTDLAFGPVELGTTRKLSVTMKNLGEATLATSFVTSDGAYVADALDFEVLPSGETKIEVSFTPPTDGPFDAVLQIASNDPDEPLRTVQLSGEGVELDIGTGAGGGSSDDGDLEDGCGCRMVGAERSTHGGGALLALGLGLALRRRRR
jgi:MYXO-CTERM domain-containing protein